MELIFLGTASCFPTANRGVSCIALRFEDGNVWLFDCGEGSQIQLQKSSVKPGKITKVFITHLHGDHLFGLPGLICTLSSQGAYKEGFVLEIFGPHGLRQYLRQNLNLSRSPLPFQYVVHELVPLADQFGEDWSSWPVNHDAQGPPHPQELPGRQIEAQDDVWNVMCGTAGEPSVLAGPLDHRVPSFGFVVQEADSPGSLDMKKLLARGVKAGPVCAKLKQGLPHILPDGSTINPSDVVGPPKPGRKVTILGDTCNSDRMSEIARSSDVLVHEATLENAMLENALEKGHSTPDMAATFAMAVEARMLVLTHFSQRYQHSSKNKTETEEPAVELLGREARAKLGGSSRCRVLLAEDLLEVAVPRLGSELKLYLQNAL